jgi:hypothetical protein
MGTFAFRLGMITGRPVVDPSGDAPEPLARGDVLLRYRSVDEWHDPSKPQG